MTVLVPFDNSGLSRAALGRARDLSRATEEDLLAVTVVPRGNAEYARERGLLDPGEPFDLRSVVAAARAAAHEVAPACEFEHLTVDRYAPPGAIAARIKQRALRADPTVVVLGSDNAGRVVGSLTSVGDSIVVTPDYDVYIVRSGKTRVCASADREGNG